MNVREQSQIIKRSTFLKLITFIKCSTFILLGIALGAQAFAVSRGSEVLEGSPLFKSTVRLEIDDSICTGTLITACSVMTAAHCFRKTNGGSRPITFFPAKSALVHIFRNNSSAPIWKATATGLAIHPGYSTGSKGRYGWSQCHDLAIVQIPCVPPQIGKALPLLEQVNRSTGRKVLVAGFGDQGKGSGQIPTNKMNDDADPLKQANNTVVSVSASNGCLVAKQIDGRVEAGDSGGPLMSKDATGVLKLEGVLSGNPNAPTDPYTSIPNFLNWICQTSGKLGAAPAACK